MYYKKTLQNKSKKKYEYFDEEWDRYDNPLEHKYTLKVKIIYLLDVVNYFLCK